MKRSGKTPTYSTDSRPSRNGSYFWLLISVSGIGGNTARMILSALSPSELCGVISSGNDKLLKTVKGIGLKTAQRIIVDLKDKIATSGVERVNSEMFANPANTEIHDEAVSALTMLGFAQAASQKVVAAILKEEPAARRESDQAGLEAIVRAIHETRDTDNADFGEIFSKSALFVFRFTSLLFLLFLHFAGYKLYFQVRFFLIFTDLFHAGQDARQFC